MSNITSKQFQAGLQPDQALAYAIEVEKGDVEDIQIAFDRGASPNAVNAREEETLVHLVLNGEAKLTQLFIANGADISSKQLLHIAASQNDLKTAEVLLRAGVDVNERDDNFNTPLFMSTRAVFGNNTNDNEQMILLLIDHGADVDLENIFGDSISTCWFGDRKLVDFALSKSIEKTASDLKNQITQALSERPPAAPEHSQNINIKAQEGFTKPKSTIRRM